MVVKARVVRAVKALRVLSGVVRVAEANKDLIGTYLAIRDNVDELIGRLESIEKTYLELDKTGRKNMYMKVRGRFNELKHLDKTEFNPEKSTLMIL